MLLGYDYPYVSLDDFEELLLPNLSTDNREKILELLLDNGSFTDADPDDPDSFASWGSLPFPRSASGAFLGEKTDLCQAFQKTCEDILNAAATVMGSPPLAVLRNTVDSWWVSESPQSQYRSDCDVIRMKIGGEDVFSLSDDAKQPDAANVIVNIKLNIEEERDLTFCTRVSDHLSEWAMEYF